MNWEIARIKQLMEGINKRVFREMSQQMQSRSYGIMANQNDEGVERNRNAIKEKRKTKTIRKREGHRWSVPRATQFSSDNLGKSVY